MRKVFQTNGKDSFVKYILMFFAIDVLIFWFKGIKYFYTSTVMFLIFMLYHILSEQIIEVEIFEGKTTITYSRFFREYKKSYVNQQLILKRFTKVHFRVSKKIDVLQLFEGKKLLAELNTLDGIDSVELDDMEKIIKENLS